jgi:hypothetical protein
LSQDVHLISGLMSHKTPFIVAELALTRIRSCCTSMPPSPRRSAGPSPSAPETRSLRRKAQGVKPGGLNAKGIANREEALERAEQLRPLFAELAGMSHRKMASALNARKIPTPAGGHGMP